MDAAVSFLHTALLRIRSSACLALGLILGPVCFAAAADSSSLIARLPANTCLVVTAGDLVKLRTNWQRTSYFELIENSSLQPFRTDLAAHDGDPFDPKTWLGCSWNELESLGAGEALLGIVSQPKETAAVLLVDCRGKTKQVDAALASAGKFFRDQRAQPETIDQAGVNLTVYRLPAGKNLPGGNTRIYFVQNDALAICNNLALAKQVVEQTAKPPEKSLAQAADVVHASVDVGMKIPNLAADLNLIFRPAPLDGEPKHGKPPETPEEWFNSLRHLGNKKVEAVALKIAFASDKNDVTVWGLAAAPWPHEKTLELLSFIPGPRLAPPAWVRGDVSAYINYRWKMDQAIKAYGHVFDEWYGEGEDGVFDDMINGLLTDPQGPQIDVRRDLIAHLGPDVFYSWNSLRPAGGPMQRQYIWAVTQKPFDLVQKTIAKYFEGDDRVKHERTDSMDVWSTRTAGRSLFSLGTKKSGSSASILALSATHLFLGNNEPYLLHALDKSQAAPLEQTTEYKQVATVLDAIQTAHTGLQAFFRSADFASGRFEAYRAAELGKETDPLSRSLFKWLKGSEHSAERLPAFDKVQGFFGVGGGTMDIVPEGWAIRGFVLKPPSTRSAPAAH